MTITSLVAIGGMAILAGLVAQTAYQVVIHPASTPHDQESPDAAWPTFDTIAERRMRNDI